MTVRTFRVGQIVPSSNTTMETEIPAILRAREAVFPHERFTFHSSRMRMKKVTKEELQAMDRDSDRCAAELADARMVKMLLDAGAEPEGANPDGQTELMLANNNGETAGVDL